ncbi:MAG: hypothetical protein M1831_002034 [Alyxoria varia]|nr:MAG: hypothetical protein M1831_002034 [Alyxoria varia]
MACIWVGFGVLAVFAFWKPNYAYHRDRRDCQIGLPTGLGIGLLCYDLFINVGLTMIFMWLLIPRLRFLFRITGRFLPQAKALGRSITGEDPPIKNKPVLVRLANVGMHRDSSGDSQEALVLARTRNKAMEQSADSMDWLVKKTMMGLLIGLIPTIVNLALLLGLHGFEHHWLCFTLCITDGESFMRLYDRHARATG